jgi:Sulfatase
MVAIQNELDQPPRRGPGAVRPLSKRWSLVCSGIIFFTTFACSKTPEPPSLQRWGRNTGPVVVRSNQPDEVSGPELEWAEHEIERVWTRVDDGETATLTSPPLPFARAESIRTIEISTTVGGRPGGLDVMWSDTTQPDKKELLTARRFFPYGGEGQRVFQLTGAQITDVSFASEKRVLRHPFLRFSPDSLTIRSVRILPRKSHSSEFQPIALNGTIREAVTLQLPAALETEAIVGGESSIRLELAALGPTTVEVSITAAAADRRNPNDATTVTRVELDREWSSLEVPATSHGRVKLSVELKGEGSTQVFCTRPMIIRLQTHRPPNVVLYVMDALRAPDLSCYGSQWKASPFLDQLASRGVLFEDCIANCSWTKPSVASLLTSLSPQIHGLGSRSHGDALPSTVATLQSIMSDAGYVTASFSANRLASNLSNLHIGYDVAMTPSAFVRREPSGKVGSEELSDALLDWMTDQREHPFFAYVHSMDPHAPLTNWETPTDIGDGETTVTTATSGRSSTTIARSSESTDGWKKTTSTARRSSSFPRITASPSEITATTATAPRPTRKRSTCPSLWFTRASCNPVESQARSNSSM